MSESLTCNTKSLRAKKAKFASNFENKNVRGFLAIAAVLLIAGWAYLVFLSSVSAAHLLLIPASLIAMILIWYAGELEQLPPSQSLEKVNDISALLSRHLLAKIKPGMSPKQLSKVISKEQGGYFFSSRYGIGQDFLEQLSADDEGSTALVWQNAISLAKTSGYDHIDSGALTGALILSIHGANDYLARISLDNKDIESGVIWFSHIRRMIERAEQKHDFGGIGRDLSFGWIPTLSKIGYNITETIERGGFLRRPVISRQQTIDQTVRFIAQEGRSNAVLVGEHGVGKTTLVYALAQKLITNTNEVPKNIAFQQVITLDAANLIANTKTPGQLEELLIRIFNEAIHAKNVVIFLDEAQLFLRSGTGSVDLSQLLMPVLQGGALKIILALSDQEWLRLSQENSALAGLMNRVIVKPLDQEETMQVVEDETVLMEARNKKVYTYQSLHEAYKLAERFIHEQAAPGKVIKLLESAANFPEQQHFVTAASVKQAIEKSFDVRVQTASSFEERDTLLNLEDKIHQRMINQTRAVKLVSDALRRARSGVRNNNKPIGTFLFLGPTGVGKTELTKSLAAAYFGGEDRMVRIDLNEYSHAEDTNRLLARGSTDPYSLCAQIAKQPFSVVLLDEIEKAHPNVLNLLLQMLDEGILRDSANKPISFKDAIIISTSNAGAEKIRAHIQAGQQLEQFEEQFVDELVDARVFRPEFLNRFDEIILFRPLTKQELLKVVDLLLASVNKTLADRKVTVKLTQRAKELLVDRGYDARLGARPLRRVMQRSVENIVASKLLAGSITPGQSIEIDAPELHTTLEQR
ncbi:ATP-dependent Clp protease ATP-binding subunit [Candidatus Saccharibacteria bacterium]|nr:ATP-dependent Clp protease ATP-binding subunit [Candidatus Saccharibacteria bacterium]